MALSKSDRKRARDMLKDAGFSSKFARSHDSSLDKAEKLAERMRTLSKGRKDLKSLETMIAADNKRSKKARSEALEGLTGRARKVYQTEVIREIENKHGINLTNEQKKEIRKDYNARDTQKAARDRMWNQMAGNGYPPSIMKVVEDYNISVGNDPHEPGQAWAVAKYIFINGLDPTNKKHIQEAIDSIVTTPLFPDMYKMDYSSSNYFPSYI